MPVYVSSPYSTVDIGTNVKEQSGGCHLSSQKKRSPTTTQSVAPVATNDDATMDDLGTAMNSADTGYGCTGLSDPSPKIAFLVPSGICECNPQLLHQD